MMSQRSTIKFQRQTTNPKDLREGRSISSFGRRRCLSQSTRPSGQRPRGRRSPLPATRRRPFALLRELCRYLSPPYFQPDNPLVPNRKTRLSQARRVLLPADQTRNRPAPLQLRYRRNPRTSTPTDRFETSSSRVLTACAPLLDQRRSTRKRFRTARGNRSTCRRQVRL